VAAEPGAVQRGLASWYGEEFANLPTASGETFRPEAISAAHRTLPLGTVVEVTNEKSGRVLQVRINDRGPFVAGRILDLSKGAAAELGSLVDGVVPISLRVVTLGANERVRVQPPGGWLVQAGAFASEANAIALRDRLSSRFPNPFLEEFQGLRRVKFGPYATRAQAEAARDSLTELGLAGVVAK
jgi:rare lipoprotein A